VHYFQHTYGKTQYLAILRKLVALFFALTLLGVQGLQAKIAHKKEAFLQLSGDQYQRIASLHPHPNKPAFVSLILQVARGGCSRWILLRVAVFLTPDQFTPKYFKVFTILVELSILKH
jgi:hypothetical protein